MDIFNYAQKLVTELGERNPVQRVVSDVSTFFMAVKTKKQVRKKEVALNPIIGKVFSDIEKTYHPYSVKTVHPIRPNDHHLEIMQLKGWLDLDLDDPDLKSLFK